MRKWFAVLAVGVCMGLPALAQQKEATKNDAVPEVLTPAAKATSNPNPFGISKSPWALSAQPRLTPFPAAAPAKDTTAPGQLLPRFETGGMYNYVNFHPGSPFNSYDS